ncbi:MAG: ABC transporter ATP-binding protein [Rhodospirillaceae bacterium]|nr:ABC transporter ATP-binding protein [Rhodospirillaceae bacterium]
MHGQDVALNGVSVRYPNGFVAVQPSDLEIKAGEFFSILGPSGCGKTTILRVISGFIQPSSGAVLIGGRNQAGVGPNDRPTALIFQNLALFPLMTVRDNVAFGLEARGMPKRQRRARADELLDLVALTGHGDKKPGQLSGGQRQRVAVARALAVNPSVLLLDEPLSALDLKLRQHMRAELRAIQKKTGVTFIYITHDQGEALTMSDRIAIMNHGRIEQVDTTSLVYDRPATSFAATFVGEMNVFRGPVIAIDGEFVSIEHELGRLTGRSLAPLQPGDDSMIFIRPERVALGPPPGNLNGTPYNALSGRLARHDLEGPFVNLFFEVGGKTIAVHTTNLGRLDVSPNQVQPVHFRGDDAIALPAGELAATYGDAAASHG